MQTTDDPAATSGAPTSPALCNCEPDHAACDDEHCHCELTKLASRSHRRDRPAHSDSVPAAAVLKVQRSAEDDIKRHRESAARSLRLVIKAATAEAERLEAAFDAPYSRTDFVSQDALRYAEALAALNATAEQYRPAQVRYGTLYAYECREPACRAAWHLSSCSPERYGARFEPYVLPQYSERPQATLLEVARLDPEVAHWLIRMTEGRP